MGKSEANFGMEIGWAGIQKSLETAQSLGWMKAADIAKYNNHVEGKVRASLQEEGKSGNLDTEVLDCLDELCVRPRVVMANLSDLGIMQASPVWKDFMKAE